MAKEEFDIGKWFNPDGGAQDKPLSGEGATAKAPQELCDNVETVTRRIEERCLDITGDYGSWRDIGFALADGLGEAGRTYFHRVSKFYPKYNAKEADKQFTQCLKGRKSGITIKTFFHKAKEAGIQTDRPCRLCVREDRRTPSRRTPHPTHGHLGSPADGQSTHHTIA